MMGPATTLLINIASGEDGEAGVSSDIELFGIRDWKLGFTVPSAITASCNRENYFKMISWVTNVYPLLLTASSERDGSISRGWIRSQIPSVLVSFGT